MTVRRTGAPETLLRSRATVDARPRAGFVGGGGAEGRMLTPWSRRSRDTGGGGGGGRCYGGRDAGVATGRPRASMRFGELSDLTDRGVWALLPPNLPSSRPPSRSTAWSRARPIHPTCSCPVVPGAFQPGPHGPCPRPPPQTAPYRPLALARRARAWRAQRLSPTSARTAPADLVDGDECAAPLLGGGQPHARVRMPQPSAATTNGISEVRGSAERRGAGGGTRTPMTNFFRTPLTRFSIGGS